MVPERVEKLVTKNGGGRYCLGIQKKKKQEWAKGAGDWGVVDRTLLGGLIVSFFTVVASLIHVGSRTVSSKSTIYLYFTRPVFLWGDLHRRFDTYGNSCVVNGKSSVPMLSRG